MKKKAHELTDSLAAVATMTKDGKALADRAMEIALQEAWDLGFIAGEKGRQQELDTAKEQIAQLERMKGIQWKH
ncbi:MAG: hypothetical protein KAJ55_16805 [Anaerolineales bacterium]|nr:hypothetical protein [Anaerolineales bacterium]